MLTGAPASIDSAEEDAGSEVAMTIGAELVVMFGKF